MRIIQKSIKSIQPYANNPRKNDAAVDAVAESIRQFGFKVPIVIDKDGVIVTGHTRVKAATLLGMEKVPCIVADDLTEEQVKAFRLADNKVSELAQWDDSLLSLELEGMDVDMSLFGFDMDSLDPWEGEKENERVRTSNAYNLGDYDEMRTDGFWQMPVIPKCDYIPEDLVGFNYVLSTKAKTNVGVHFYIDDYQFERIWNDPHTYIEKLRAWGCALSPDFSLYMDMPRAMKLWNTYRSRAVGQMMSDAGVRVIPTLSWAEPETFDFCFDGIEPGGVVSVSTVGVKRHSEAMEIWTAGMDEAIKRLSPSCVLEYGGDIGYQYPCEVKRYKNHVTEDMTKWADEGLAPRAEVPAELAE